MEMAQITRGMSAATEGESIVARVNRDRLQAIGEAPRPARTDTAVEISLARERRVRELREQLEAVEAKVDDEAATGRGHFAVPWGGDKAVGKKAQPRSRFAAPKPAGAVRSRFAT